MMRNVRGTERDWLVAGGKAGGAAARGHVGEVILLSKTAIDAASNASSERALDAGAVAANQNRESDFGMRLVGISQKPTDVGNLVGASAGLSGGHFVATCVVTALAGTVENSGEHAFAKFGK